MFSAFQLVLSGMGMSALACIAGLRAGRAMFCSVGMLMIFQAWLQIINFNGSWPSDQPFRDDYYVSKAEDARLWAAIGPNMSAMTTTDWADYHRCRDHNVCVRRFARK